MRVGIFLLLLLTAMSIYGATFLQHQAALAKVYSSWWFVGTLALTGLNLLVCSLNRWDAILKRVTDLDTGMGFKSLDRMECKAYLPRKGRDEEAARRVLAFLGRRGFRAGLFPRDKGILVAADKGRFGHFGSLVTHMSLVLLLLGAGLGIFGGFESFDGGFAGRVFTIPEAGFSVRIDNFEIKYRDDKSVEQYYSTLTVLQDGREVKQETIYVNRPLRHQGVVLYQSTYGWGVKARFVHLETGRQGENLLLRPGQAYQHPETGIRLQLIDFFPDATMTQTGMPFSRSSMPVNPRVAFRFLSAAGQVMGQPFYLEPPDTRLELLQEGYVLEFLGWQNYTGFQIVKNPGKPVVLLASLLMISGLFMSFYLFPRRVWAYIGPETEGRVLLAGRSHRHKVGFALDFKRLAADLQKNWEE
jgi:cytochrome c biogenesis protein